MSEKAKADKAATAPKWSLLESAMWSPAKAGDKVEGTLGATETGPYGEQYTIMDADCSDASGEDFGGHGMVVLPHLAALADLSRVTIGTDVRITYTGEKVSAAGNTYKAFTIEVAA